MKKLLPVLLLFFLLSFLTLYFPKPANAALPTFTWQVADQNGTPLENALVWVYWKGQYFSWCSTDSSGRCSVTLSCATPCELSGDVEYQGYTGSYSGAYSDGALIEVVINILVPSPTPSPPPYPTPSPYPSPTPTPPPPPSPLICIPEECDGSWWELLLGHCERTSRPVDCQPCNETNLYCPSCATSFTVHDTVSYHWYEGTPEEPHCVERDWGGTVTINAEDTTIPFVGKQEEEDEKKYLADYFEGTHDYYRTYPLSINVGPIHLESVLHGVNPIFTTNFQGVLRKLTPMEYQNQLKKEMIERIPTSSGPAQEGQIHDYDLNYIERLCWDAPLWADVLAEILDRIVNASSIPVNLDLNKITHYCLYRFNAIDEATIGLVRLALNEFNEHSPFKILVFDQDGVRRRLSTLKNNYPPEPDEEDYVKKWNEWKFSAPGKLSVAGRLWEVTPMVSREDTPGYIAPYYGWKPEDTPRYIAPRVDKVPHVARLYEASQLVKNILMPFGGSGALSQKKTELVVASAKEGVLEEKTLLAQAGCIPCRCKVYYPSPDCSCMTRKKPDGEPECNAEQNLQEFCGYHVGRYGGCICGYAHCQPAPPGCECCLPFCSGYGEPTPSGVCGLAGARPVVDCEQPAITNSNPNDKICGPKIEIPLSAIDRFINESYTECTDYTCGPTGTGLCPDDPCLNVTTEEVSRKFGINLSHPYLTEIWNQTGKTETAGLFNIFRPATYPKFQEIDASSEIIYSQTGFESIEPSVGKFYFNYLGGVQLAKDWLIRALTPWVE